MEKREATIRRLRRRRDYVMLELHPELRARVKPILEALDWKLTPWEGYRNNDRQQKAFDGGWSNAKPGQSPHNYEPALAVDLVLNPEKVEVIPNWKDPRYPNLWDDVSTSARAVWQALDELASQHHLVRVSVGGKPDLPHLEMPNWKQIVEVEGLG